MSAIGPGDLVECIDAAGGDFGAERTVGLTPLVEGGIYVVDLVGEGFAADGRKSEAVTLMSPKGFDASGQELAFRLARFRPVRRPNSDFINTLKQPAPPAVRELLVDA